MSKHFKRYAGDWRESLVYFCKGYITGYTNAGIFHYCDKRKSWKFGYWLGGGEPVKSPNDN